MTRGNEKAQSPPTERTGQSMQEGWGHPGLAVMQIIIQRLDRS
jgi:hypothetical protein